MEILMKPFLLDIIIVFFVIFMMILGYKKGFVVRLYDLAVTIGAGLIASIMAQVLSYTWIIYQLPAPLEEAGQTVNQLIIFVILFIVLKLTGKVLGIVIKPVLKKILSILKLTEFADKILGMGLSFLESLIFIYIIVIIVVSPLVAGGNQMISDSMLAQAIVSRVPFYTDQVMEMNLISDFSALDLSAKDTSGVTIVSDVLFQLDRAGLIDEATLNTFMVNYYSDISGVTVDHQTYQQLEQFCQKHSLNSQDILKGLIVGEGYEE